MIRSLSCWEVNGLKENCIRLIIRISKTLVVGVDSLDEEKKGKLLK